MRIAFRGMAAALTVVAACSGFAQPLTPSPTTPETQLQEILNGTPASKTKTASCTPARTGAKQVHLGVPGVSLAPAGEGRPPLAVGEFRPYVFVVCSKGMPRIFFVPSTGDDSGFATEALSIIGAAHLGGKALNIIYDPADVSGQDLGCASPICKRMLAITMVEPAPGE